LNEIPTKPYLLRALYEWCVDNGYTPHLAVKVDSRTQVPQEYVKNGEITLNISPNAVHKLQLGNELVEFSARFGGVARQISVPITGVYALYARETGHGMTFDVEGHAVTGLARVERVHACDRHRDLPRHAAEARGKLDQLIAQLQLMHRVRADVERYLAVLHVLLRHLGARVDLYREVRRIAVVHAPFIQRAQEVGLGRDLVQATFALPFRTASGPL